METVNTVLKETSQEPLVDLKLVGEQVKLYQSVAVSKKKSSTVRASRIITKLVDFE